MVITVQDKCRTQYLPQSWTCFIQGFIDYQRCIWSVDYVQLGRRDHAKSRGTSRVNSSPPVRRQAITWTNAGSLSIGLLAKIQLNLNRNSIISIKKIFENVVCQKVGHFVQGAWVKTAHKYISIHHKLFCERTRGWASWPHVASLIVIPTCKSPDVDLCSTLHGLSGCRDNKNM